MFAIFKREFLSYFRSPVGYVAFALFSFLSGFMFINQFGTGMVNISSEIISLRSFFIIIVPIITMGLFADDKKRGTEIIFYTSPISLIDAVVGKFLAAFSLFAIMFINVFVHMIITKACSGIIDAGTWGSVIVFFFLAAMFIAIGIFASAITDSQIISAILCFLLILLTQLISTVGSFVGSFIASICSASVFNMKAEQIANVNEKITSAFSWFDPFTKTQDFRFGIFSVSPLIFCFSVAVIFIYLTYRVLEMKRWSQA